MLEILDRPLVFLCRLTAGERPEVLALPRLLIGTTAIDTKFTGFELTNHAYFRCRPGRPTHLLNHDIFLSSSPEYDLRRPFSNPLREDLT